MWIILRRLIIFSLKLHAVVVVMSKKNKNGCMTKASTLKPIQHSGRGCCCRNSYRFRDKNEGRKGWVLFSVITALYWLINPSFQKKRSGQMEEHRVNTHERRCESLSECTFRAFQVARSLSGISRVFFKEYSLFKLSYSKHETNDFKYVWRVL